MKIAIVLAAICFLGVVFAAPTSAPDAAAKPNAFADWQKAFQETLNNLLGQNKNNNKPKRDLTADILTAVMNMNNPVVLAQTMFKIMTQLNAMGQEKAAESSAPANNLAGEAIVLLTKTNDPMAFAMQLFKIVNTLANDNKVVIPAGAAKPKFNFLKNPVLKNPNWNKKPATAETEVEVEVVEEVSEEKVEESTEATVERVVRQERPPEWEPTFKDQMKANAYNIIGVGNVLEYLDAKKAKKAQKAKRDLYKKTPTGWKKASDSDAVEEKVEDSTEAAVERVARQERLPEWEPTFKDQMKANAYGIVGVGNLLEYMDAKKAKKAQKSKREGEATPASAKEFSVKDFGKMVDNFYAQFQAPKKSA